MLSFREYIEREQEELNDLELYKAGENLKGAHRILLKANRFVNLNEYAIYILREGLVLDGSFCRLDSYLANRDEIICIYTNRQFRNLKIDGRKIKTFFLNDNRDIELEKDDVVVLIKINKEDSIKVSSSKLKIRVHCHG